MTAWIEGICWLLVERAEFSYPRDRCSRRQGCEREGEGARIISDIPGTLGLFVRVSSVGRLLAQLGYIDVRNALAEQPIGWICKNKI